MPVAILPRMDVWFTVWYDFNSMLGGEVSLGRVVVGCSVLEQDLTGDVVVAALGEDKGLVVLSEVHSSLYKPCATALPLGHIAYREMEDVHVSKRIVKVVLQEFFIPLNKGHLKPVVFRSTSRTVLH